MDAPETGIAALPATQIADVDGALIAHTPAFLVIDDDPVQSMTMARVGSKTVRAP